MMLPVLWKMVRNAPNVKVRARAYEHIVNLSLKDGAKPRLVPALERSGALSGRFER